MIVVNFYITFFFFVFLSFSGCTKGTWRFPGQGSNQSCSCWPTPRPQQCQISATAMPDLSHICNLHHSSWQRQILNPLSRLGIEPTSSWILVGFVTAEPPQELPLGLCFLSASYVLLSNPHSLPSPHEVLSFLSVKQAQAQTLGPG